MNNRAVLKYDLGNQLLSDDASFSNTAYHIPCEALKKKLLGAIIEKSKILLT